MDKGCSYLLVSTILLVLASQTTSFLYRGSSQTNKIESLSEIKAEEVDNLLQDFWEWKLLNNPEFATKIGISRYNDRLNELSVNSYKRREIEVKTFAKKLKTITAGKLVQNNHTLLLNIQLFTANLHQFLMGQKFKSYLYPLSIMESPDRTYLKLISQARKISVGDYQNLLTRMRATSQQIDEIITLLNEGIRLKFTLNRRSFEPLIDRYYNLATTDVERSAFFKVFDRRPLNINMEEWMALVEEAKMAIQKYIQPSFKKLYGFLRYRYLRKSRIGIGAISLPQGSDYYQACLQYHTTTLLTALQIHNIGLSEVARIANRMEEVKEQVRFNGSLTEFRKYLRNDESFGFNDENHILRYYNEIREKVQPMMPKYIKKMPTLKLEIRPVPKDIAPQAIFAWYDEPSADGRIPGIFYVNTYAAKKRRKYVAPSLFLHEALPGHHVQIASKIELGSPALFRRYMGMDVSYHEVPGAFSKNSAYLEGWGLYSEFLGEEMGLYSDPYDMFGRLSQEMLRAARLVVDTGIHAFGWSRKRAVEFMRENTAGSLHDIENEVDRYISWPGQACSYKIGELKILELRRLAEDTLGDKFELRDFHDFVISMGNIPLDILEKEFQFYLKKKK